MIKAEVEDKAVKTQAYVNHILSKCVECFPLSKGKKIEIKVQENLSPFPEITEKTDYYKDGKLTIPEADYERERREVRTSAFIKYNQEKFKGLLFFLNPNEVVGNVIRGTLKFEVINPNKIYVEARKYGVEISDEALLLGNNDASVARFLDNPTRIIWKSKEIIIPPNTKLVCLHTVASSKEVGEVIHWDEVASEIDGLPKNQIKTKSRTVYDLVRAMNDKIIPKTGKPLFENSKLSFRRLA